MKGFIFWVCRISGVEKKIRDDERQYIKGMINDAHYWFSNTNEKQRIPVFNALHKISQDLNNLGYFNADRLRDYVDDLGFNRYVDKQKTR